MLALTNTAAEVINALTQQEDGRQGGLRLAMEESPEGEAQLSLAVSPAPEEGDAALGSESGAQVFLDAAAADFLDDKVLDVTQDEQGQVSFALYPQQEG